MKNTKVFAKICLMAHIAAAIIMVAMGIYASFSQSATSPDGDKFLRIYLESGMLTFTTLMLCAKRRQNALYIKWVKIRHWHIWLVTVISFVGVSATNVIDYTLEDPNMTDPTKVAFHYAFTALLALSATFFSWHYYRWDLKGRKWALGWCIVGGLGFGLSVLFTWMDITVQILGKVVTISLGELLISIAIAFVVWPVINEQLT